VDTNLILTIMFVLVITVVVLESAQPLKSKLQRLRHLQWDSLNFALALCLDLTVKGYIYQWYVHLSPMVATPDFSGLHWGIRVTLAVLLSDFLLYWFHRLSHRQQWLWHTHRWHHSVEELYWFSGLRSSAIEVVFYTAIQLIAGTLIFNLSTFEFTVVFAFGLSCQLWSHSNIRTPVWLPLHLLFVTPEYHHLHHAEGGMIKQNYGAMLSIWDRMFATTYRHLSFSQDLSYGLRRRQNYWRMLIGF
jgi:sterol desaturase/sphingolipid hydroxylase (fatty acid hydroxylase superfamily)